MRCRLARQLSDTSLGFIMQCCQKFPRLQNHARLIHAGSNTGRDGQERANTAGFEALPIGMPAMRGLDSHSKLNSCKQPSIWFQLALVRVANFLSHYFSPLRAKIK